MHEANTALLDILVDNSVIIPSFQNRTSTFISWLTGQNVQKLQILTFFTSYIAGILKVPLWIVILHFGAYHDTSWENMMVIEAFFRPYISLHIIFNHEVSGHITITYGKILQSFTKNHDLLWFASLHFREVTRIYITRLAGQWGPLMTYQLDCLS